MINLNNTLQNLIIVKILLHLYKLVDRYLLSLITTERSIDNSEASNRSFTSADKPVLVIKSFGSTTENESTSILEETD